MKFGKYLTTLAVFGLVTGVALPANAFSFTSETFTASESNNGSGLFAPSEPIDPIDVTFTDLPTPAEDTFDLQVEFTDFDLGGEFEFLKILVSNADTGLNSEPETFTDSGLNVLFNPRDRNGSFEVENIPFNGFSGGDFGLRFVGSDFGGPFKEVEEGKSVGELKGSISYEAVPEPLTMLGIGTAIGLGGVLKRKYGKKV